MTIDAVLGANGTIGDVTDHRVRLTDQELDLIVSALSARLAAVGHGRRAAMESLITRLSEPTRGNPMHTHGGVRRLRCDYCGQWKVATKVHLTNTDMMACAECVAFNE